jgi:nucleotide-binding universal stress UspA family protein
MPPDAPPTNPADPAAGQPGGDKAVALKEERERRRAAEAELAELKQQLAARTSAPPTNAVLPVPETAQLYQQLDALDAADPLDPQAHKDLIGAMRQTLKLVESQQQSVAQVQRKSAADQAAQEWRDQQERWEIWQHPDPRIRRQLQAMANELVKEGKPISEAVEQAAREVSDLLVAGSARQPGAAPVPRGPPPPASPAAASALKPVPFRPEGTTVREKLASLNSWATRRLVEKLGG